jgi:glycosyltransferase involved in cell wall biosynthesis
MNVAIFASAYYPHVGGVEEACRQLAREYQRRGMGVIVLTNRWPRSLTDLQVVDGVRVHRLPMRIAGDSLKSKIMAAVTTGMVRRQMMEILRRFSPDVLHVQCASSNAAYALWAKRAMAVPLVVTLQGELTMDASGLFQRMEWAQGVMRDSLDSADAVTACSGQTLQEAEAWHGKPIGERGTVIHNGIALSDSDRACGHDHPRPYILAIGRHVAQKGFDLLLRAMAELRDSGQMSHYLILAGDGPEHDRLKALAGDLKLLDRTVFAGRVDHKSALGLFAGCSFFVLPSRHEPFGIVNLEAMAAGKAVVAAKVGGVAEVVEDGVSGILVERENVSALAAAIRTLMGDEPLRRRLGLAGRKRAESFTWSAAAERYCKIYANIIGSIQATRFEQADPEPAMSLS